MYIPPQADNDDDYAEASVREEQAEQALRQRLRARYLLASMINSESTNSLATPLLTPGVLDDSAGGAPRFAVLPHAAAAGVHAHAARARSAWTGAHGGHAAAPNCMYGGSAVRADRGMHCTHGYAHGAHYGAGGSTLSVVPEAGSRPVMQTVG